MTSNSSFYTKEQKPVPSSSQTAVGDTVVTSMHFPIVGSPSIRVRTEKTMRLIKRVVPVLNGSGESVVESLVILFYARTSNNALSLKENGRLEQSLIETARVIAEFQSEDCKEQSFVKYWSDFYLAQSLGDSERPVRDAWIDRKLFSGWCLRFVHRRMAKRDVSFFYSLSKGTKQMWQPLGLENLRKAVRKSMANLTIARGESSSLLRRAVRRLSAKVFGRDILPLNIAGTKMMPSMSACSQASVSDGGALSLFAPMEKPTPDDTRVIGERRAFAMKFDRWRQSTLNTSLSRCWSCLSRPNGFGELFDVKYVPIYEPAKIRGISVGNGDLYTALQPLQGRMLDDWKATRWSTMTEEDLTVSIRTMDEEVDEEFWVSGDYESATDLLRKDLSIAALDGISHNPLSFLALLSFSYGSITYPDPDHPNFGTKRGGTVTRTLEEGQLMGHPLSFPLLCVINAAVLEVSVHRWCNQAKTTSEYQSRRSRGSRIVKYAKINGDDILFKAPRDLIDIFINVVSADAGFKISVGKNYVSKDACMINSQLFKRVDGKMRRFGYLNLRIIKGMNVKARIAAGERPVSPISIGRELNKMFELCPWASSALDLAMERFDNKSKSFRWFHPNWYLPVHLGGYGIHPKWRDGSWSITRNQRIVAAMFIRHPELALFRTSGLPFKATKITYSLLRPYPVWGDSVPHESEVPADQIIDQWGARFMAINRAMSMDRTLFPDYDLTTELFISNLKREYSLHPLSAQGIEAYWNIRWYAYKSLECPPLNFLKAPGFGFSVEPLATQ